MSTLSFQAALCDSPIFAINCDVLLEASVTNDKNSRVGLRRVWRVGSSPLMIYCHRDRRWAPGHVAAGLPLPHCLTLFPDLGPLAHSVPRARPAQSHMLAGTWQAGRREAGKERNAISSLGVCLPFKSGCFN